MTRINVIFPSELCDQHLLAEHRELTRIPNDIAKRKGNVTLTTLKAYTLGKGHVIFFRNKLLFLKKRYEAIHRECLNRGFSVIDRWPDEVSVYNHLWKDYQVTNVDIAINEARIRERMPTKPRFSLHLNKSIQN
ncbi:deoxyribonuclease [Xenorhabdus sp. Reich]|uniref:Deoxyribonuclease n=1 Tax=Xenorhabdus littoralis TaxID=2582835 RepID=A0ABU4SP40_9GAMM|nr:MULTISPECIES: pyrimidine dimer DNA glycosylase/endonuclease V [unclassified Xenorhabdus]MDX7991870.1 deoxyribonuclease [Xenorhabdus sp. psl]MDX8000431.1 deoxyribonuclease [Xenorhabdus sp. Reich]